MERLLCIELSPDDPRIEAYRKRMDVVKVTVYLDPRLAVKDSFAVLSDGKVFRDPFNPETDPFHIERWDLFIDQLGQELWTSPDQLPKRINATDPLKLLDLLLDHYPGEVTPSLIRECLGKYDYNGAAIRQLYQRLRSLIGRDMILASSRGLNTDKIIIIKEKPPWKPNTITK